MAVRDALALRAGGDGIFVAVDDVQWLDGSSVNALVFALRRITESVTLLLTRQHDDPRNRRDGRFMRSSTSPTQHRKHVVGG